MSIRNRVPSLLEPYLQLPAELSLTLITGTLGCSPHWLTSLFVGSTLPATPASGESLNAEAAPDIVFVSWMRDADFWKSHIRRTTGIDVSKFEQQGRIIFMDCLSPIANGSTSDMVGNTERRIRGSIAKLSSPESGKRQALLILDSPDVLLAIGSATAQQLMAMTIRLRGLVHSTILSCSADLPLVSAAGKESHSAARFPPLPLEVENAAFVTQIAHTAHVVMSVRELQTGAAKDVSGVVQVTRAADAYESENAPPREVEALYLVHRDGAVKVFARGQGAS